MLFLILFICFLFPSSVFADSSVIISGYSATSPEYVELKNTSSSDVNLEGWLIKDDNDLDDDISLTSEDVIPANSTKQFTNTNKAAWLNDTGDIIYLYDNLSNLIDKVSYPTPTPTKTPTPTLASTNTPTPTATPTTDPAVTNPSSGVILNEFMPYTTSPTYEWIELYNSNDYDVKLTGWKVTDSASNSRSVPDITISAKSYVTFDFAIMLNNDGDKISLINNSGSTVNDYEYSGNNDSLDYSWSLVSGTWCRAIITKGSANSSSCRAVATSTPVSTLTPTPNQTKYTDSDTATESAIIEPTNESSFLEITSTPVPTVGLVLGENISSIAKRNYLPLIFIVGGGLLLTSPVIITKIKNFKNKK